MTDPTSVDWVVLTMGDRPAEVERAIESLRQDATNDVVLVVNSIDELVDVPDDLLVVEPGANLGVPGGRDAGLGVCSAPVVGFLDDDAVLSPGAVERIREEFDARPEVGAVSLRIVDDLGETSRRHVPRRGNTKVDESGVVTLFLGGACAIRRTAYEQVGGYFAELRYGHEEVELCWRLIDAGWSISYLAETTVFHPRTEISRHVDGWTLTGRNRVWIARRTLPLLVAAVHVTVWLVLGVIRAPSGCRTGYVRGWLSGWRGPIGRSPISWRGVWRLAGLGRPPVY